MVYYTYYKLMVIVEEKKIDFEKEAQKILKSKYMAPFQKQDAIAALVDINAETILNDFRMNGTSSEIDIHGQLPHAAWRNHESELIYFSRKYPEALFILAAVEENRLNIWRKYFKDGGIYFEEAKISFEDFDESKLK